MASYSLGGCANGSPITAVPACEPLLQGKLCSTKLIDEADQKSCLCKQGMINELRECQNELRLCFRGNDLDPTLEAAFMSWHALCDNYVTFNPTTPPLSEITSDRNDNFCQTLIKGACNSAKLGYAACSTITDPLKLYPCACAPSLIAQDYSCEFLGNTSCLATAATLSNLWAHASCSNFGAVMSSIQSVTGVIITPTLPPQSTGTPTPGASTEPLPSSTRPSTGTKSQLGVFLLVWMLLCVAALLA